MADKNISRKHVVARLVTDAIYLDDTLYWNLLTEEESTIAATIEEMGSARLVVDREMGMGFLRPLNPQEEEEIAVAGYAPIPKVIPVRTLGYHASVLCALLRQELQAFEEKVVGHQYLYLGEEDLVKLLSPFMPELSDQKKLTREVHKVIARLLEVGVLHKLANRSDAIFRVEPIIRARITIDALQKLLARLVEHNNGKAEADEIDGDEPSQGKATQ
jgi:uncharacterized protein DUF4194